jgi:3-methyladenine DNA glycosylase AlkD
MNESTENLLHNLRFLANADNALQMSAYMKNHFPFYGIKTPERRIISKQFFKDYQPKNTEEIIKTAKFLWQQKERECHYIAIELLAFHKKKFDETIITVYEEFTITNSWWDSVDSICSNVLDFYFKKFTHQILPITTAWNNSENMWLQRNSIMFQKFFNENTNTSLLAKNILNCAASKEFFIQKAIGWALREYAYTNPNWVRDFVSNNTLPKLSKSEALKHL